ncbi:MAG: hypothetical protein HYU84_15715 [Chloroflexi bacterium]|nr:hypothetical protein [Chloroflexota bacterium]MBI3168790.1 hypothetical protein [Chloroflexota bacterium]
MPQVDFATTTISTILLWGLGLLVFLIGGLLGYFNMNMDSRKKLETADQKIEAARAEADRRIAEAQKKLEEAKALSAQAPQVVNEPSLLRLKSNDGLRVQIEMDGQMLNAPLTPERRKRLIELINHVRPWLEAPTAAPQAATPPPAVSTPLATPPTRQEPVPVPAVPPTVKPVPAALTVNPQKPKTDPEVEFKLLSMVKQIDFVLQKRIAGTPLESMSIHLNDTLHGGLEVQIGTQKFETIDDVPDANVRTAIRAAIAEWEQKYVPGA